MLIPQPKKWPVQDRFINLLTSLKPIFYNYEEHEEHEKLLESSERQSSLQLFPLRLKYEECAVLECLVLPLSLEAYNCYLTSMTSRDTGQKLLFSHKSNFRLKLKNNEILDWHELYPWYVATYNIIPSRSFMEKLNYFLTNELPAQIKLAQEILRDIPDPIQNHSTTQEPEDEHKSLDTSDSLFSGFRL